MFGIIRIMNLKASSILSHRVYDLGVPFGGSLISCCWMVESNSLTSCCDLLKKGLFPACLHSQPCSAIFLQFVGLCIF